MEPDIKILRVFRTLREGRTGKEWQYIKAGDSYNRMMTTSDPLEAEQFQNQTPEKIAKRFTSLEESNKTNGDIELVEIKIVTEVSQINLNDGEILEERRKIALQKLNQADIEALGLHKLASYNKLKFHGDS